MTERILGKRRMPWEGDGRAARALRRRLGRAADAVLSLLHRNPYQRMTVEAFEQQWNALSTDCGGFSL